MTHGVTYLPETDIIIVMKDGLISEMGSYAELLKANGGFADFLREFIQASQMPDDGKLYINLKRRE